MERIYALEEKIRLMEEGRAREEKLRKELQGQNTQLMTEKVELLESLVMQKDIVKEMRDKAAQLSAQKYVLESELRDIKSRLEREVGATSDLLEKKRRAEEQLTGLKRNLEEVNTNVDKVERDRVEKEKQIKALEMRMAARRDQ